MQELEKKVDALESKPVKADELTFSLKLIASVIMICLTVVASFWSVRSSVSDLQRDFNNKAELQNEKDDAIKAALHDSTEQWNLRFEEVKSDTSDLKKNMEMRRVEIQQLREIVTAGKR